MILRPIVNNSFLKVAVGLGTCDLVNSADYELCAFRESVVDTSQSLTY